MVILMTMKAFLTLCLFLFLSAPAFAATLAGKVVGISDGNSITVLVDKTQVKVILYGIDCPELRQAFGSRARAVTSKAVHGKQVELDVRNIDRHGHTVAVVTCDGVVLQEILLKIFQYSIV